MPWRPASKCSQASCFGFQPSTATLNFVFFFCCCSKLFIYFSAEATWLYFFPSFYYKDYLGFVGTMQLYRPWPLTARFLWTAASWASGVAAWSPRGDPARSQISWKCFSPTPPMNCLKNKGMPPPCLCRRRRRMWRVDNRVFCFPVCMWGLAEKVKKVSIQLRYDSTDWMKR